MILSHTQLRHTHNTTTLRLSSHPWDTTFFSSSSGHPTASPTQSSMLLQILCTILVKLLSPVRELIFGRLFCAVAISAMSRASCYMLHSFMSFHDFSFYFSFSIFFSFCCAIFFLPLSRCNVRIRVSFVVSRSTNSHNISRRRKKTVQSEAGQGTVCYSFVGGHSPNYIANELPTSSSRTAEPSWTARNVSCRRRRGKIGKHKNKRSLAHTFSQIRDVFRFLKYPFSHIFTLSFHRTHKVWTIWQHQQQQLSEELIVLLCKKNWKQVFGKGFLPHSSSHARREVVRRRRRRRVFEEEDGNGKVPELVFFCSFAPAMNCVKKILFLLMTAAMEAKKNCFHSFTGELAARDWCERRIFFAASCSYIRLHDMKERWWKFRALFFAVAAADAFCWSFLNLYDICSLSCSPFLWL